VLGLLPSSLSAPFLHSRVKERHQTCSKEAQSLPVGPSTLHAPNLPGARPALSCFLPAYLAALGDGAPCARASARCRPGAEHGAGLAQCQWPWRPLCVCQLQEGGMQSSCSSGVSRGSLTSVQIASFTIVVEQLKNIYEAFFITTCDRCRGTGIVTCPHVSAAGSWLSGAPASEAPGAPGPLLLSRKPRVGHPAPGQAGTPSWPSAACRRAAVPRDEGPAGTAGLPAHAQPEDSGQPQRPLHLLPLRARHQI
jgi:hypothetical protein